MTEEEKELIQKAVCSYYGVRMEDMCGPARRMYPALAARDALMFAYNSCGETVQSIADEFGVTPRLIWAILFRVRRSIEYRERAGLDVEDIARRLEYYSAECGGKLNEAVEEAKKPRFVRMMMRRKKNKKGKTKKK